MIKSKRRSLALKPKMNLLFLDFWEDLNWRKLKLFSSGIIHCDSIWWVGDGTEPRCSLGQCVQKPDQLDCWTQEEGCLAEFWWGLSLPRSRINHSTVPARTFTKNQKSGHNYPKEGHSPMGSKDRLYGLTASLTLPRFQAFIWSQGWTAS